MRSSLRAPIVLLALALLPVTGAAGATYGTDTRLEADAPIAIAGEADSLFPNGVMSLVGDSATSVLRGGLDAREAHLTYRVVDPDCPPGPLLPECATRPSPTQARHDEFVLTDAEITIRRVLSASKLVVTTDRQYAETPVFGAGGKLVATTAAATALGANPSTLTTSPYERDWTTSSGEAPTKPVYELEALGGHLTADGARISATGGFEVLFQGVEIDIRGTDEEGEAYERTIRTPYPREGEPYTFLVVEVNGGDLAVTGTSAFTGYAPPDQRPVVDVHARAAFDEAEGVVDRDGSREDVSGSDITLDGPMSITLVRVVDGDPPRVGVQVADGLRLAEIAPPDREPQDTASLIAAGSAGAGGAGLLLAGAYFWPRLKFAATALIAPLYTRIDKRSVLEHEKREELYELIRGSPGIHAHEIGERAKIGWGTTVYHLKQLETHGLVVSKKSGRYKRFFVNTGEYTKKKDVYGALRNETAKRIAEYVAANPGTNQKDMCAALDIKPSLASWHVERLEGVELVKRVKDGRMVKYYSGPAWGEVAPPTAVSGDETASA